MDHCQGRRKTKKFNFKKNPLESIELPYENILALCGNQTKSQNYNLRKFHQDEQFILQIKNVVNLYIDHIEFSHLKTQKEAEEIQLNEDLGEASSQNQEDKTENILNGDDFIEEFSEESGTEEEKNDELNKQNNENFMHEEQEFELIKDSMKKLVLNDGDNEEEKFDRYDMTRPFFPKMKIGRKEKNLLFYDFDLDNQEEQIIILTFCLIST